MRRGKSGILLDDIVILVGGFEENMKNMEQVLSRFRVFKVKLQPSKCELFNRDIPFFESPGKHGGFNHNPEKVKGVKDWPTPSNKADLGSFLGLLHF